MLVTRSSLSLSVVVVVVVVVVLGRLTISEEPMSSITELACEDSALV